jgi:hypothetical protein
MSIVRTAVVQGAVTAMSLQPRTRQTFHSPNVLKSLVTIRGFENQTLRLNHPSQIDAFVMIPFCGILRVTEGVGQILIGRLYKSNLVLKKPCTNIKPRLASSQGMW